jgi:TetR/AcrR family transcriptional regulator
MRILDAALREFSSLGMAGARMDQIAAAAGVNKALLYYHFDSKENLYAAALEMIAGRVRDQSMSVFLLKVSPGERLIRSALNHFDRILTQGEFQSLMQQEMMRMHQGEASAMSIVVKRVFAPMQAMQQSMVREGIVSGELINADWMQIHLSTLGANVFYFLAAPVWRLLMDFDPFAPEVLAARRRSMVEFLGQTVFVDRAHGAELAAKVLDDTPMPELPSTRHFVGRNDERKK